MTYFDFTYHSASSYLHDAAAVVNEKRKLQQTLDDKLGPVSKYRQAPFHTYCY